MTQRAIAGVCCACWLLLTLTSQAAAQSDSESKGFTWYETFQGSSNVLGQVYKADSTVGYNFSKKFGVDAGIPVYFVQPSSTAASGTTATTMSGNGIGNAYVDLRLTLLNPLVNVVSNLDGTAPTGDTSKGLSTGRATFDWNNHLDRSFLGFTPFANVGIANTVSDTTLFTRPFTTLGLVGHLEGGASYRLLHFFSVGASAYDILPSGQQKVFSKLIPRRSSQPVTGGGTPASGRSHGGVFEGATETTGSADIAKDNGFSAWLHVSPVPFLDLEGGYTRSVTYDLNTVSFQVGFNLGYLVRKAKHPL